MKMRNRLLFIRVGATTGRPLLRPDFARYNWDYGKLARALGADGMLVQTQIYCKKGIEEFRSAMAKLKSQQTAAGLPMDRVFPQAVNGAPVPQVVACVREARQVGAGRISLWFAPARVEKAVEFFKGIGR